MQIPTKKQTNIWIQPLDQEHISHCLARRYEMSNIYIQCLTGYFDIQYHYKLCWWISNHGVNQCRRRSYEQCYPTKFDQQQEWWPKWSHSPDKSWRNRHVLASGKCSSSILQGWRFVRVSKFLNRILKLFYCRSSFKSISKYSFYQQSCRNCNIYNK